MSIWSRLKNGWNLGMTSLEVIKDNPSLLLFPLLSGGAILLIVATFIGSFFQMYGWNPDVLQSMEQGGNDYTMMVVGFLFYLVSFFIVIFFNVALVHNARLIFRGEEPTVRDGIRFASGKIGTIFSWAVLAATVAIIFKTIREKAGVFGSIVASIGGIIWTLGTYFVVPVLAFEDVKPMEALRKSADMMKKNWGETIGANFSFGVFSFLGFIAAVIVAVVLIYIGINPSYGIILGVLIYILTLLASEAAKSVFLAAAYQYLHDEPHGPFEDDLLENSFYSK